MKKLLTLLTIFLMSGNCFAADAKISALTAAASITSDDLFLIVDDPAGTPVNKKVTGTVMLTAYQAADADLTYLAGFTPTANVKTILNAADYAAIRTALALVIGTNVEAWDADLDYLAGFTPTANVKTILNAADYAAIRTALALVIGTNVQAYDADLTTYAGITPAANVQSILGAADYAAIKTLLALTIGTNVQAYDADLTTYAGITPSANIQSLLGSADYATARTNLGVTGKQTLWIPAASFRPSATGGAAAVTAIATTANQPDIQSMDFDTTTQEYAQFSVALPKQYNNSTVTFKAYWTHPSTTTNFGVVWDLQCVAESDDDAIAAAYGTAQTSTDTGGTTNDVYISPESSAITIAGTPAAEDLIQCRLSRVTGNGSDTMAVDAKLLGIKLYITTNTGNDS